MKFFYLVLVLQLAGFNALADEPFERLHCEIQKVKNDPGAKWTLFWMQERYAIKFEPVAQTFAAAFHASGDDYQNVVGFCFESYVANDQNRVRFYTYKADTNLFLSFNPCKAAGDNLVENMTSFIPERGTTIKRIVPWTNGEDYIDFIHFLAKDETRTDEQICNDIVDEYNKDL